MKIFDNFDILSIDDDEKINYSKSSISNKAGHYLSLEELLMIYKESPEDIYRYNTSNCLTLILKSGREISLHEFKNQEILFFKIFDDTLRMANSEILLKYDQEICQSVRWDAYRTGISHMEFFGWKLTNQMNQYLSADYANGYRQWLKVSEEDKQYFNNENTVNTYCQKNIKDKKKNIYKPYVPSLYQMKILFDVNDIIQDIIIKTNKKQKSNYSDFIGHTYWTSTKYEGKDFDNNYIWIITAPRDELPINVACAGTNASKSLVPLYKKN